MPPHSLFTLITVHTPHCPQAPPQKPDTGPGPGSYEMQGYEGIQSHLEKGASRKSPGFHQLEYTDRFGRSVVWMYCARGLGQSLMTDGYGMGGACPRGSALGGNRCGSVAWFHMTAVLAAPRFRDLNQ